MKSATNRLPNNYPRSLPFRAPDNVQARLDSLRRWNVFFLLMTCTVFVGAVATVVFMNKRLETNPVEKTDAIMSRFKIALDETSRKTEMPSALPKVIEKSVKPFDPNQREMFLEALGGLSAVHLYQSYLNLGLVADAVEKEAYTTAEATKILQTVEDLITLVDNRLTRLAQADLDADDQQVLARIRAVTEQLRLQANSLRGFWTTGDRNHITRYHQARTRSWTELRDLLEIEE